jgi:hypothetical protein
MGKKKKKKCRQLAEIMAAKLKNDPKKPLRPNVLHINQEVAEKWSNSVAVLYVLHTKTEIISRNRLSRLDDFLSLRTIIIW